MLHLSRVFIIQFLRLKSLIPPFSLKHKMLASIGEEAKALKFTISLRQENKIQQKTKVFHFSCPVKIIKRLRGASPAGWPCSTVA